MDEITEIELQAAEAMGAKYDAICRTLFLNKEILAPVLKQVVPEYKDCTIEEVIACIDADSIGSDAVDDMSVTVKGAPTEMYSASEKLIRYDARFVALNPKLSTENIQFYLHIDIEVQNSYRPSNPSYPIIKRAIYYAAREISSQLGVLTGETNYAKLQKTYSIWICNEDIPKALQNTVTSYAITKQDVIGSTDEPDADYDLMTVIIIRRGNNDGKAEIFDYLTGIFLSDLGKISTYIDIEKNQELKEEVNKMSGMGLSIARENMNIGIREGLIAGRKEGEGTGLNKGMALISRLFSEGRIDDAKKVTEDPQYRNKLLKEYGLAD